MENKINILKNQLWSLNTIPFGKVLVIDFEEISKIVHFSYFVKESIIIYHIPIDFESFLNSINECIGSKKITKKMIQAKSIWEKENGGVWELNIEEIIDLTLNG
jgi:hypothetical protein